MKKENEIGDAKGYVLIIVLAIVVMLTMGIAAMMQATSGHTSMKSRNLGEVKAQYRAEAAMQLWMDGCKTNPTTLCINRNFDMDGDNVHVEATQTSANPPQYSIKVTANY